MNPWLWLSHSCSFGFISSDPSTCSTVVFPVLGNSDYIVSVFIVCPSNSKRDTPFHRTAYDNSLAGWDGRRDNLRENIYYWMGEYLLLNFLSGSTFKLMYISFIGNIRSIFTFISMVFRCSCCCHRSSKILNEDQTG